MKPSHIIILVIVLLIIFGTAKLPDIARSLGQSAKVMKKELRELQDDPKQIPPQGQPYPQPGQAPYAQPGQAPQQGGYVPGEQIPGQALPQQPYPQQPYPQTPPNPNGDGQADNQQHQ
ncbi:MAG: twin-arginine translocase TatA/TatE family subunit [Trueperella sp.]|uniref:twin-arginine translocase TatA/TatE family subunit n=1 Tax=Trueperella sp. TaxID=2699835 RepID=UPI002A90AF16|nr:twin-arginine translocase TatA/TatE family subunit [Trueperella sp.]MDY5403047.1 twin-arginine translocase TatA/TatE family subunit [Trueperella sp.]